MRQEGANNLVLVFGATGRQGGAVTRHLRRQGWGVRALTRSANSPRAAALRGAGVEVVVGDLSDPESIAAAMRGCYGVFSVQNYWEHGLVHEVAQGKRVVDQARHAGVQHFVFASVARCREAGIPPYLATKGEVERYVEASGLPYTHIRPGFLMDMLDRRSVREHRMVTDSLWMMQKRLLGREGRSASATDEVGVRSRAGFPFRRCGRCGASRNNWDRKLSSIAAGIFKST